MSNSLEEALEEVARAAKLARRGQQVAEQEAAESRAQATEWERKYRKEQEVAKHLRELLERTNRSSEDATTSLRLPPRHLVVRRNTVPPPGGCIGGLAPSQSAPVDAYNMPPELRSEASDASGVGLNITTLASTLGACVLLRQASRRLFPNSNGMNHLHSQQSESYEHTTVSLADDGYSGVGATAAAAVSVALAQSWAAVAGGKSSCLPDRSIPIQPGKARFKLVAAIPRNSNKVPTTPRSASRRDGGSSPTPSSSTGNLIDDGEQIETTNGERMVTSPSEMSLLPGEPAMALESLDDPRVMDDTQEASWRASGSHLKLQWLSAPSTVLIVSKPDPEVLRVTARAVAWLLRHGLTVFAEPSAHDNIRSATRDILRCVENKLPPGSTLAQRSDSTGSTVFGTSPPRSAPCNAAAEAAEAERSAAIQDADDADDLLDRLLLTWSLKDCDCTDTVPPLVAGKLDLLLTFGGDGTVLWACSLLGHDAVPPIVPLAMGSLGFMTPFPLSRMDAVLARVTSVAHSFPLMLRHRLQCRILRDGDPAAESADVRTAPCGEDVLVLNEVVIDRGMTASLANLQCFVDKNFVTTIQGDGLIVSTPTGSTAYNLAAGGSMVHPSVPCLLFTPICPHTLSSRPLVFPEHVTLRVKVPADSRAEAYCSFDGKGRQVLRPGDSVLIYLAQWPVPMVCNLDSSHDWFLSVREGLHWNRRVVQKPMG